MKIGLFITGHFRNHPISYENYKQFIDGHDLSVYVATWSTSNIDRNTHTLDLTPTNVEPLLVNVFGSSLKRLWIGDMHQFMSNLPPAPNCPPRVLWSDYISPDNDPLVEAHPWPQRSLDQWYAVKQAYLLAGDEYNTFDVVVRIRGDQVFLGKPRIPFDDIRPGIHVNGYTWWDNPEDREHGTLVDSSDLRPYALSDQLAWGSPYWMTKYFEYYDHFAKLWAPKLTVWHKSSQEEFRKPNSFLYNTEHMMSYYIQKYPYYYTSEVVDMPWYRHGHNDNPHNRFDSDFYTWG